MPWNEFHIKTTAEHTDALSEQLTLLGASAITLKDAGDQPIYEPTATTPRIWPETIIVALFEKDQAIQPILSYLDKQQNNLKIQSYSIQAVDDEDWVRRSLDQFKPLCFGSRLWICPTWHEPPNTNSVNVMLDPGLAFGTGTHPTTALCLEWLDKHVTSEDLVIDYGCGSGILGIAAYKLGVKKIIAVDNDPQALIATRQNAEQNNIDPLVFITQLSSDKLETKADIVIANILAQPLITLADKLAHLTKPGGYIVLSGILRNQVDEIKKAYGVWFDMEPAVCKEDWVRLVGLRRIIQPL